MSAGPDAQPPLRIRGLRVNRGGRAIVRGVDLDVSAGSIVGMLGPSGAGKSTVFRAIAGELPAASGTIEIDSHDVTRWPMWRRARAGLGYVPQDPSVLWDYSVFDNLRLFRRACGLGEERSDVERAASDVDLNDRLDVRASSLSGGERRRLELARALTTSPRILVCDEPLSGIDPQGAARIADRLARLASSGVAVLFADHHVAEALRVCHRAVLLLDGAVAVDAPPDAFQEDPLVQGRYLGSWSRSLPPPAGADFSK